MLMSPKFTGFNYMTGNVITTRPAASGYGTSITPAQNAYGSYTEILSDTLVTKDCFGIYIWITGISQTGQATDSLCTIGIDPTGGTSYTDLIPHLLCSCASSNIGVWYYFPIYIPAGSAIAAKGSINNATVGTQTVAVWLWGDPTDTTQLVFGHGVEAIGITAASSSGTAVTSGTTSEGSWTSLGTTTKKCFYWQYGMGVNDSTMTSGNIYTCDLSVGDGTNQILIGSDKYYLVQSAAEQIGNISMTGVPNYKEVPVGGTIYGRIQCSGTSDTGLSMAAYGVY